MVILVIICPSAGGVVACGMKTIAACSTPDEAHLLRSRLEAAGIPAYVRDEHTVQMDWFYSNAIGGVRVDIADEDEELAREFLASEAPETPEPAVAILCPACGSAHTTHSDLSRRMGIFTAWLLSFPMPFGRSAWKCADCGHQFKVSRDPAFQAGRHTV